MNEGTRKTAAKAPVRKEMDMVNGSLWDKILLYALPLAATGILQQLFNAADVAVVGRCTGELGAVCMAAVGASSPVIGLLVHSFTGISLGTNVVVANAVGGRDEDVIRKAVHTSVVLALVMGVLLMVCGELFAEPMLRSQNVPEEVLGPAVRYLRIYLLGVPLVLLYNFAAAIFRGWGDTRTPLIALTAAGAANVVLNFVFVAGLGMTVDGVALATLISSGMSAVVLLAGMLRTRSAIRLCRASLRPDGPILARILRIGIPAGLQGAVFSFANLIIQTAINSLGTIVMAASGAAFNIEIFAYDVMNSFAQACTTFTGQNYGAGKLGRCRRTLALCLAEGYLGLGAAVALILFFGRELLGLFNADPEVIRSGYVRLMYIFFAYAFSTLYEDISGYLRGYGISLVPALLTMAGVCGTRIAWIYLVFPAHRSFASIMTVYPVSLAVTAALMISVLLVLRPARRLEMRNTGAGN